MKSVQVVAPGEISYSDAPEPDASREVLVGVQSVGICGTDVKIYSGAIDVAYPRIMGHEMIGSVVSSAHPSLTAGQRVLVDPAISCGICGLCRAGRANLCPNGGLLGRDVDGVFAEYIAVPADRVLPVPRSVDEASAGLLQVLGTCVHAMRSVRVVPGDTALVIGLGVSGLLFVQLLRLAGATVIGVTRSEWKRHLATQMGASVVAEPEEMESAVMGATGGLGADLVVEAVGVEATVSQAIELVRVGGEVVVFGTVTSGQKGLPYYQMYFKELVIHNPRAALTSDYERGINLVASGALSLASIVTHRFHLSEAQRALDKVKSPESLKVLMEVA